MSAICLPNFSYRFATLKGRLLRAAYRVLLPWIVRIPCGPATSIEVCVYSFSCERDLAEQIASIRSFIRHVGIPKRFTVVSDGTYTPRSCNLLRKINPCVRVATIDDFIRKDLPGSALSYASAHVLGKKLAVLLSMPVTGPTIYTDSDILFFAGSSELRRLVKQRTKHPRYLLDSETSLDSKILHDQEELNPVNSGFLLLFEELDWRSALTRLDCYDGVPTYFTEQTIVHLAMHYTQAEQLDPERYICTRADETIYTDQYCKRDIALRHYTGPVRHKFWSYLT